MNMKKVVGWLLVIGAVNMGAQGLLNWNFIDSMLGGAGAPLDRAVYVVIGLAGLYKGYMMLGGDKKK